MSNNKYYLLKDGVQGADRFEIWHELFVPGSIDFIHKSRIIDGMKIADLGCGIGTMSCEFAKLFPNSKITGFDISQAQIDLANQRIQSENITNITFDISPLQNIKEKIAEFDAVYSRFLYRNVLNPEQIFEDLYSYMKPGCIVICEEAIDNTAWQSSEGSAAAFIFELYSKIRQEIGLDPDTAFKLRDSFQKLGMKNLQTSIFQPLYQTERERSSLVLLVDELRDSFLQQRVLTSQEVDELRDEVIELISDQSKVISCYTNLQISAMK